MSDDFTIGIITGGVICNSFETESVVILPQHQENDSAKAERKREKELAKAERKLKRAEHKCAKALAKAQRDLNPDNDQYKVVKTTSFGTTTMTGPVVVTNSSPKITSMTFGKGYSKSIVDGYTIEVTKLPDGKTLRKITYPDGRVEENTYDGTPPVIF